MSVLRAVSVPGEEGGDGMVRGNGEEKGPTLDSRSQHCFIFALLEQSFKHSHDMLHLLHMDMDTHEQVGCTYTTTLTKMSDTCTNVVNANILIA